MRRFGGLGALLLLLVCLLPLHAQQPPRAPDQIRGELQALAAIQCDPATPLEVREINRRALDSRRAELRTALRRSIVALDNYRSSVRFLTAAEREDIAGRIRALEKDEDAARPDAPLCSSTAAANSTVATVAAAQAAAPAAPAPPANQAPAAKASIAAPAAPAAAPRSGAQPVALQPAPQPGPAAAPPAPAALPAAPPVVASDPAPAAPPQATQNPKPGTTAGAPIPVPEKPASTAATPLLKASNDKITFSTFKIGEFAEQTVVVSKNGDNDVKIKAINVTGTDNAEFKVVRPTDCEEKEGVGITLAGSKTCTLTIRFKPNEAGDRLASLEVVYDGQGAPLQIPLTGTGKLVPLVFSSMFTRAVAGIDVSGASSFPSQQKFFIEFSLSAPMKLLITPKKMTAEQALDQRFWLWFNPRVTALPQQTSSLLSSLSPTGNLPSTLLSSKLNQTVQGFEFLGGIEYVLGRAPYAVRFGDAKLSPSIVLAGGVTTPFSVPDRTQQEFSVNSTITNAFPGVTKGCKDAMGMPADCTIIAFLSPDRDRFFRQYYAGLRVKTYFYGSGKADDKTCPGKSLDEPCDIFPGVFDAMVGQNESVTGGKLRNVVLRLEGFYPLPFYPPVHLYLTTVMKMSSPKINQHPLVLESPANPVTLSDKSVFLQTLDTTDRDFYRLGIGIDLVDMINRLRSKNAGPTLDLKPNELIFGDKAAGLTSDPQTITVGNSGTGKLSIYVVKSDGDNFTVDPKDCMNSSPLATGDKCTITVKFAPGTTVTGKVSGKIMITDSTADSPHAIKLSGTATPKTGTSTP
jgi:hypothetical protein